jgi:hypothetical protein
MWGWRAVAGFGGIVTMGSPRRLSLRSACCSLIVNRARKKAAPVGGPSLGRKRRRRALLPAQLLCHSQNGPPEGVTGVEAGFFIAQRGREIRAVCRVMNSLAGDGGGSGVGSVGSDNILGVRICLFLWLLTIRNKKRTLALSRNRGDHGPGQAKRVAAEAR